LASIVQHFWRHAAEFGCRTDGANYGDGLQISFPQGGVPPQSLRIGGMPPQLS
jgi:hypothetical protein